MRWRLPAAICLAALVPLTAGCGSSRNDASDTNALLGTLRSLKPGEILIIGKRSPRTAGPFSFEAGGYLLRFTQPRGAHLRVSVRSSTSTGSDAERLLTDTTRARGAEHVDIAGRLYVRVVASAHSYTLRFTPRGDWRITKHGYGPGGKNPRQAVANWRARGGKYMEESWGTPPHFHAIYGEYEAQIVIETLELMGGELPARALRLIREFEPLKDPALFRQVRVDEELGTVARTRATLRSSVQELRFHSPL